MHKLQNNIQNNIQNNSDITSAGNKDKCQVDTCQTYDVESLSEWTSEREIYRVGFGLNHRFCRQMPLFSSKTGFFASIFFS